MRHVLRAISAIADMTLPPSLFENYSSSGERLSNGSASNGNVLNIAVTVGLILLFIVCWLKAVLLFVKSPGGQH